MTLISLSEIRRDGRTQVRVVIDGGAIDRYAETIKDLPPMVVFFDGADYWLADGFHRWAAHHRVGNESVECQVRSGTVEDARCYATNVETNGKHGVPLSNKDKRRAVKMALETMPDWSDRRIAEHVGVTHNIVAKVRRELAPDASSPPKPAEPRTGRDGKVRRVPQPEVAATPDQIARAQRRKEHDGRRHTKQARRARALAERARPLFEQGMSDKDVQKATGATPAEVHTAKARLGFARVRRPKGPIANWALEAVASATAWDDRATDDRAPWADATADDLEAAETALRRARDAMSRAIKTIVNERKSRP